MEFHLVGIKQTLKRFARIFPITSFPAFTSYPSTGSLCFPLLYPQPLVSSPPPLGIHPCSVTLHYGSLFVLLYASRPSWLIPLPAPPRRTRKVVVIILPLPRPEQLFTPSLEWCFDGFFPTCCWEERRAFCRCLGRGRDWISRRWGFGCWWHDVMYVEFEFVIW